MLEAIVALPDQLFYNTGISTYIWVLNNRKSSERKGKVQLINAVSFFKKMTKSLGNKRNEMSDDDIDKVSKLYGEFKEGKYSKIFDNEDFGYAQITVERPLQKSVKITEEKLNTLDNVIKFKDENRLDKVKAVLKSKLLDKKLLDLSVFEDELEAKMKENDLKIGWRNKNKIVDHFSENDDAAEIVKDKDGNPVPDTDKRDKENVPLKEDIQEYFEREVKPHVPDAWIDEDKTKIGYEINFTKYFYEYTPLRSLEEITRDILELEKESDGLLKEVLK